MGNPENSLYMAVEQRDRGALERHLVHAPAKSGDRAIRLAASLGLVEYVLPLVAVSADNGASGLRVAITYQQMAVVDALLPTVSPRALNTILIECVMRQNVGWVKKILPHANPKSRNSKALQLAAMYSTSAAQEIVQILLPVSNVPRALQGLYNRSMGDFSVRVLEEYIKQQELQRTLKKELKNEVGRSICALRKRKM